MIKSSIILMLVTILSKILGFFRDILISYYYGASGVSDAYLISQTIPDTFFMTVGVAISTSFIPIYSALKETKNNKEEEFTNNLINSFGILGFLISVIGIIFSPIIVSFFASGFEGKIFELTVLLTRISFIGLTFTTLTSIFKSYLQINNEFIISGSIGIPLNIIVLFFIIISSYTNPILLGIGSVLAHIIQMIYLFPILKNKGYRYKFIIDFNDKNLLKIFKMSVPVILGVSINQLNIIVGRTIASGVTIGGVSTLSYASRISSLLQTIFITTILTIVYPTFSRLAANKDKYFNIALSKTLSMVSFLTIPSSIGIMIFSKEIIILLYGRGDITTEAIGATSEVLFYYSLGLFAIGIQQVLSRAFYSFKDTKTPAINALLGLVLNIILSLLLSRYIGLIGIAISSTISTAVISVLLFIKLKRSVEDFQMTSLLINIIKILLASIIMGVITYFIHILLGQFWSPTITLLVSIIVGIMIYMALSILFRLEEGTIIIDILKKKIT